MQTPSAAAVDHSQKLIAYICDRIAKRHGYIGFDDYMQAALYAPGLGYYQSGSHKIGQAGDFITAPEISDLFGHCIAGQLKQILSDLTKPIILELGAGSGKMAADILERLQQEECLPQAYWILEPSPDLQARQKQLLQKRHPDLIARLRWLTSLPTTPFNGVIIANEVLDALPVKRFQVHNGNVFEYGVGYNGTRFCWRTGPALTLPFPINPDWPEGFISEVNMTLPAWLTAITKPLQCGAVLFFDYGYAAREYYQPDRSVGTLMCYYQHQKHDDPFVYPGLQDITAHVNFTAVAEAAVDCGLELTGYTTQALFLASNEIDALAQTYQDEHPNSTLSLQSQLRQLMLPQHMGDLVKAMALSKNLDTIAFDHWPDMRPTL